MTYTILSWKTSKALAILPEHYPQSSPLPVVGNSVVHEWLELAGGMKVVVCTLNCGGCLRATVLDGQIRIYGRGKISHHIDC